MNVNKPVDADKLRHANRTLSMISACNQMLARTVDEAELLRALCHIAIENGGYHLSWVGLAETAEAQTVRPVVHSGFATGPLETDHLTGVDTDHGRGPAGVAIRTRKPVISRDLASVPAMAPWRDSALNHGDHSSIALPFVIGGQTFGAWMIVSTQPDAFDDAEVSLLKELIRDIEFGIHALRLRAENQRAEEALRKREATLSSVFRAAPAGICIIKDRVFESANKYWCDMVGCSEEALIGKSTRILYESDKEFERVGRELYANSHKRGLASIESRVLCGKTPRDVIIMVAPVQPEAPSAGVVTIIRDITNYKNAERKLKQYRTRLEEMVAARTTELQAANEQLEAIFQTANVGIAVLRDRIVMRCNARLEAILGYEPGGLTGTSTHPWYTSEADYETVGRDVADTIWKGKVYQSTQRYKRKDGTVFWARLTDRALDVSDPRKGLVAVIDDISAERAYEKSLQHALARAEESDRLKSAFLATMSHELRTPLNSIIGFTGILLQELAGPLNAEQSKQLGMVQNSARHLLALINDVLDISKIEAGQMQVEDGLFDLHASMVKVAGIIKPQAEKKGLSLHVRLAPEIGMWMSDARRVEQVLLNLLNNAVKFTDRGAVTLTAEIASDTLRISVADTGIGIKPEDLSQLFQPFRQVDTGLSRQHEGTGLGLAICRRLARLLGGEIHAASDWGKGSVFALTLPRKTTGPEPCLGEPEKGTPR